MSINLSYVTWFNANILTEIELVLHNYNIMCLISTFKERLSKVVFSILIVSRILFI